MTSDQKDAIAGIIVTQQMQNGVHIVNEGDMANSYYIIKKGVVSISSQGKFVKTL
jgi:cGMP-dependent protein kinase